MEFKGRKEFGDGVIVDIYDGSNVAGRTVNGEGSHKFSVADEARVDFLVEEFLDIWSNNYDVPYKSLNIHDIDNSDYVQLKFAFDKAKAGPGITPRNKYIQISALVLDIAKQYGLTDVFVNFGTGINHLGRQEEKFEPYKANINDIKFVSSYKEDYSLSLATSKEFDSDVYKSQFGSCQYDYLNSSAFYNTITFLLNKRAPKACIDIYSADGKKYWHLTLSNIVNSKCGLSLLSDIIKVCELTDDTKIYWRSVW